MAPWHLTLNDDCCLKLFELCDGKSLAHIARTDKRLLARVSDRNSTAASPGAQVWRQLCASHSLRQPGTRTRGQLPWSKVYALSICIECSEFGEVVINDPPNVLGFERGRFALCRRCMRSDTLWRVMNRPEIRGDGQKLAHLLFRIETVRRELGLKPRYKRTVMASSARASSARTSRSAPTTSKRRRRPRTTLQSTVGRHIAAQDAAPPPAPSAANNWGLDTPNPILPFNDYYGHPPSARALLNAIGRDPSSITVINGVTGAPYRPGPDAGGGANS